MPVETEEYQGRVEDRPVTCQLYFEAHNPLSFFPMEQKTKQNQKTAGMTPAPPNPFPSLPCS